MRNHRTRDIALGQLADGARSATAMMAALALIGLSTAPAPAQTAPASSQAPQPAAATFSVDSPLGEVFASPAARAVIGAYVPDLLTDPLARYAPLVSLRYVQPFTKGMTLAVMERIDAELAKIAAPAPDLSGPAGDPVYRPRQLQLAHVPKGTGRKRRLFDGRTLNGWDSWLGPAAQTPGAAPIGLNRDTNGIFSVVRVDGAPAIRIDGSIWGTLTTKGDYSRYHLHLEYKWGAKRTPADAPPPRNNGVLYHSFGPFGALAGTWMNAIEYEIIPGQVGGISPVGFDLSVGAPVARDPALTTPTRRRFAIDGRVARVGARGFEYVQGASDPERPVGEWNAIDLYVVGDSAVHVLNGAPLVEIHEARVKAAPLTHGRIQLQSEGAETFFRNVTIEPIRSLPAIVARP